ncbi:UNVERIFIED_ORG: hypothetical protein BDU10_9175 [Burkholderia sp. CF145]
MATHGRIVKRFPKEVKPDIDIEAVARPSVLRLKRDKARLATEAAATKRGRAGA